MTTQRYAFLKALPIAFLFFTVPAVAQSTADNGVVFLACSWTEYRSQIFDAAPDKPIKSSEGFGPYIFKIDKNSKTITNADFYGSQQGPKVWSGQFSEEKITWTNLDYKNEEEYCSINRRTRDFHRKSGHPEVMRIDARS